MSSIIHIFTGPRNLIERALRPGTDDSEEHHYERWKGNLTSMERREGRAAAVVSSIDGRREGGHAHKKDERDVSGLLRAFK